MHRRAWSGFITSCLIFPPCSLGKKEDHPPTSSSGPRGLGGPCPNTMVCYYRVWYVPWPRRLARTTAMGGQARTWALLSPRGRCPREPGFVLLKNMACALSDCCTALSFAIASGLVLPVRPPSLPNPSAHPSHARPPSSRQTGQHGRDGLAEHLAVSARDGRAQEDTQSVDGEEAVGAIGQRGW